MWSDWLVVCDCSFSLSSLQSSLLVPTVLLGFLLPWTWVSLHSCSSKVQLLLPDHLPVSWENLYTCQEARVRTSYGTTYWFKIEKGVWQGCLLSSCLFNLYTERIIGNSELDESQVGIKTAGKNTNNFRCKWFHFNGRKWRGTKEPLHKGEREE